MHVMPAVAVLGIALPAFCDTPIKAAVITHEGGAHLGIYFRALAAIDEVGEVVLVDMDGTEVEDAREALGDKLSAVYGDTIAMLDAEKPVMALVSMEARRAPEAIEAALDAGCHVVAEKPACVNAEEFARLVDKAKAKERHLMLALANRMNPEVLEARRAIAEGELGQIYGLVMHLIQDQTRLTRESYHASWFADKDRAGGGHLAWLGIHWLDLAMFVTGANIEAVTGFAGNVGGQPINIEDSVAMAMRFSSGAFGTLTSGYYLEKGFQGRTRIWGSKGWLEIQSTPPQSVTIHSTAGGEQTTTTFNRPDGFNVYIAFLRAAVRASAGLEAPPIDANESLRALRAVFRTYDAAEAGGVRALD